VREKSVETTKSHISKLQYGDPPFKRFKNSPALPIGLILFIASISLLIWNETAGFRADKHLSEGLRLVVPVSNGTVEEGNFRQRLRKEYRYTKEPIMSVLTR